MRITKNIRIFAKNYIHYVKNKNIFTGKVRSKHQRNQSQSVQRISVDRVTFW